MDRTVIEEFIRNIDDKQLYFDSFCSSIREAKTGLAKLVYESIDFIESDTPLKRYNQTKEDWLSSGKDLNEELLFHGTYPPNIKSIFSNGFDVTTLGTNTQNKGIYGRGIYLTGRPAKAICYTVPQDRSHNGPMWDEFETYSIILCKVLTGNRLNVPHFNGSCTKKDRSELIKKNPYYEQEISDEYDSHFQPKASENVIKDGSQILPVAVVTFNIVPYILPNVKNR